MKKALFLDRDGIINEDVAYPHKPDQIRFIEPVFDLCRQAQAKGYLLVVITNQAGVAKGYFTEDDVRSLHAWMQEQFTLRGITVSRFYYCPFHKNGTVAAYAVDSPLRKPQPGMILLAQKDLDIDIRASLMVGDKPSDRILLEGLRSVVVKSGYAPHEYDVERLEDVAALL